MRMIFADNHTLVRETIGDLFFQLDPTVTVVQARDVAEITVKVHLNGIYRKLGVNNRSQAVRRIIESDLDFATRERLSAWIRPSPTFGRWAGPEVSSPTGAT